MSATPDESVGAPLTFVVRVELSTLDTPRSAGEKFTAELQKTPLYEIWDALAKRYVDNVQAAREKRRNDPERAKARARRRRKRGHHHRGRA